VKRLALSMMIGFGLLMRVAPALALTCPTGQHQVCHSGSGRGGGYHSTCSCVNNPPPTCVTAWGTQIVAGTSVILYPAYVAYYPNKCSGTMVTCDFDPTTNTLTLNPDITGYTVCNVIYPDTEDNGN